MRLEDWPERLAAWVDRVRDRPFSWGEWDCAVAAADAIRAITGLADPLDKLRWSDARVAARILQAEGGIEAAVTRRLGFPFSPVYAMRGDLVLIHNAESDELSRDVLAVCLGQTAAAPCATGLGFVEMRFARKAWAV